MANQLTIRIGKTGGVTMQSLALAVAAAAGSQAFAFTAAAQPAESLEPCEAVNPIFYPESLIAIGGALVVGVLVGVWVTRNRQTRK
jgi:hypothetical protein